MIDPELAYNTMRMISNYTEREYDAGLFLHRDCQEYIDSIKEYFIGMAAGKFEIDIISNHGTCSLVKKGDSMSSYVIALKNIGQYL